MINRSAGEVEVTSMMKHGHAAMFFDVAAIEVFELRFAALDQKHVAVITHHSYY